jgi:hypothetical protein
LSRQRWNTVTKIINLSIPLKEGFNIQIIVIKMTERTGRFRILNSAVMFWKEVNAASVSGKKVKTFNNKTAGNQVNTPPLAQ